MAKRGKKRERRSVVLEPNAAGIDVGAEEIYVAVPPDRDEESGDYRPEHLFTLKQSLAGYRIRLPVDPVSAFGRVAAGQLPSTRGDLCPSHSVAAPWQSAGDGRGAHSAHAEGAQPDELATPPCAQRHHRNQWPSDSRCYPRGPARSRRTGAPRKSSSPRSVRMSAAFATPLPSRHGLASVRKNESAAERCCPVKPAR